MWYLIGMYLASIIIANLTIAYFGIGFAIVNAFVLIALDLTVGDRLHELWHQNHLLRNSFLLIASGSILSTILDYQALPVAIASFCAFAISQTSDRLAYHYWYDQKWRIKVNRSNIISAGLDSILFLTLLTLLTHQPITLQLPVLIIGQWLAKVIGGYFWSFLLQPRHKEVK